MWLGENHREERGYAAGQEPFWINLVIRMPVNSWVGLEEAEEKQTELCADLYVEMQK